MAFRLEKTIAGVDIVVDGWEGGIAGNPYKGLADMRNIDNVSVEGEASVALGVQAMFTQGAITNVTFTYDHNTGNFTYNGVIPLEINSVVTFSNSGGALPLGLSANTAYYITSITSGIFFTISAVSAGGAPTIPSTDGTGTNSFSTIQMGTPKFFASGPVIVAGTATTMYYFVIDSNGRCWVYNGSNLGNTGKWVYMHNQSSESSIALEQGSGLVLYKNYLIWFTPNYINIISIVDFSSGLVTLAHLTTLSSWFQHWATILASANSDDSRYAIVAQDDSVYFCLNTSVGSLMQALGQIFNVASTHTVTDGVTTNASPNISTVTAFFQSTDVGAVIVGVGIPDGAYIKSVTDNKHAVISANATISDTGVDFTITAGASLNTEALLLPTSDLANCLAELGVNLLIGGVNNFIYPWDRTSPSYSFPIFLSEFFVSRMVTVNTTCYIFCGYSGRIYQTNGSNVDIYWELPEYLANTTNPYFFWTDANFNRNQLYFGFQCKSNSGSTINQFGGLWSIDVKTGFGKLQNIMSYNTYSGYVNALGVYRGITQRINPSNDGYGLFMGWNDGSVGGIDKGYSTPYTGGQARIDSDMIPVGTFLTKKTFQNLEFKLSTPLVTGESVALYYRPSITDAFTLVDISQGGGVGEISGIATVNFEQIQWLQVRAVLTSTASSPSFVRLREIRIR